MRRDRLRRLEARGRRHRRDDDVGVRDRIRRRIRKPRADRGAGLPERRAAIFGKQNVPRRDALDSGLAQARGDRLTGLAEPDEAETRRVVGHAPESLRCTRASKRATLTTTRVYEPSPIRSLSSNASTRKSIARPSTRVTTAIARRPMPTGVAA